MGSPAQMMLWQKEHAVTKAQADKMTAEELKDKFIVGLLHQEEAPEYTEQYAKMVANLMGGDDK